MYDHQLRVYGEYLAQEQLLPANTKVVGNGGAQRAGGQLGASEIIITAKTPCSVGAGKSIILTLETGADDTSFSLMPVSFKWTNGASVKQWAEGEVIGRMPLPSDCDRFARIFIATDDAAATGKVDVTFGYLPR